MLRLLIILPCLLLMYQPLIAKVESPNYEFNISTFDDFYPEKKVNELDAKYGKGQLLGKNSGLQTLSYSVTHPRYKFTVHLQEKDGTIHDFFARLPSYFLHDVFLQSLVNKLGKQTSYKKVEEEAFYVWKSNGLIHLYSAACTITCFPIFYSVEKEGNKKSLLSQMKKASQGK